MDFSDFSFDELDDLSVQNLIFRTNEVSAILKGHLFIEGILETLIKQKLPKPDAIFNKQQISFSLKVSLAEALGLLPKQYISPINEINRIRNKLAHNFTYELSIGDLQKLRVHWKPIQEKAFKGACTKGIEDAAMIATLFLCWSCIHLIKKI